MHEALEQFMNAINTGDINEFIKFLNEKVVFYYGKETISGLDEIKKCYEEGAEVLKEEKYWPSDINIIHTTDNLLVCTYQFNYNGYISGKFVEGHGRASNIFIKSEKTNQWELLHEYRDTYSF